MSKNIVNGVVILDAIPVGDLNTAKRLKDDLLDLSYTLDTRLEIRYFRLEEAGDLDSAISTILNEVENEHLIPWLHLEGHGAADESGFLLAKGQACSWDRLGKIITPLNIKTDLNTHLILATCYGGTFAKTISTTDRAPVSGLIGPAQEVKTGEVEKGFVAFYKAFFTSASLRDALIALQKTASEARYYRTTAERFFYEVWCSYKKLQCTPAELHNRARRMRKEAKLNGLNKLPSIGSLKRLIVNKDTELFEKYRDTYFLYDISKTTRERYPVTYKDAVNKCEELAKRPTRARKNRAPFS